MWMHWKNRDNSEDSCDPSPHCSFFIKLDEKFVIFIYPTCHRLQNRKMENYMWLDLSFGPSESRLPYLNSFSAGSLHHYILNDGSPFVQLQLDLKVVSKILLHETSLIFHSSAVSPFASSSISCSHLNLLLSTWIATLVSAVLPLRLSCS